MTNLKEKIEKDTNVVEPKKKVFLENFLKIDSETKEDIALTVVEDGKLGNLYWFSLFLSAVIAALGLLQNSIPVVIGVMLIAPLFRPIQSFSFAIITASNKAVWKSFWQIVLSILLVVFSSIVVAWVIPVKIETGEILARTNPNILDFFIAGFSAAIAFLALFYKKRLSSSIAGVAMAASLLPPLSVVGIEILYGKYFLAWNSFLLFLTNIVAIVLVGIILFFIFGFKPHQEDDKEKFKKNILILLLIISIITLPLLASIVSMSNKIDREIFLNSEIKKYFTEDNIEFNKIKILRLNDSSEKLFLDIRYFSKEKDFSEIKNKIEKIKNDWKNRYKKNVQFKIFLTRSEKIDI